MKTAYISIGRNVQGRPMPSEEWENFKGALRVVAEKYGEGVSYAGGIGRYDRVLEETYIVAVSLALGVPANLVREDLSHLAQYYGQESIALTVGEGELITPDWRGQHGPGLAD
jgi:hypothetical protein